MPGKVLLVDDDPTLLRFVGEFLTSEGYAVHTADRGEKALKTFYQNRPDLIILDIMMPGMDGWEVAARVREMAETPIILLTAKTSEADKLRGFRLGVDDYVTKPFSLAELAARARAVLSRLVPAEDGAAKVFLAGPLAVDVGKREVRLDGRPLDLTPTEFRLLAHLARHAGEAVAQDDLVTEVWGDYRARGESALRRYIWLVRQKIERDPEDPQRLVTVRGFGYRLEV
jgi:DNA-binding response OmpR family regulator